MDSTGLGQGPVAGCCECSDEPSGSCATELVTVILRKHSSAVNSRKVYSFDLSDTSGFNSAPPPRFSTLMKFCLMEPSNVHYHFDPRWFQM
jgi:hypothetical protein